MAEMTLAELRRVHAREFAEMHVQKREWRTIREKRRARAQAAGVDPDDLYAQRLAQPGQFRPTDPRSINQVQRTRPRVNWSLHPRLVEMLRDKARTERGPLGKYRSLSAHVETALALYLNVPLADPDLPEQPLELCPQCELGLLTNGTCRQCHWHRFGTKRQKAKHRRRAEWDIEIDGEQIQGRPWERRY